ncbi:MAG: hypothetical protein ACHQ1H_14485 [Nitrososphaerales archaeon]
MPHRPFARGIVIVIFLSFGFGLQATYEANPRPQQKTLLDLTIKSCADFTVTESHLDAAFHTVTVGYDTIPTQKEPVPRIEGVENPEKMQEFMDWYANGGSLDMSVSGEGCSMEMFIKSGDPDAVRAEAYIRGVRELNAEFFADRLLKKCTGKGLKGFSKKQTP